MSRARIVSVLLAVALWAAGAPCIAQPEAAAADPCVIPDALRTTPPLQDSEPVEVAIDIVMLDFVDVFDIDDRGCWFDRPDLADPNRPSDCAPVALCATSIHSQERPLVVVSAHPVGGHAAHLGKGFEDVAVQHFGAKGPVESLDSGVLRRLAGLVELQPDLVPLGPIGQHLADQGCGTL